MFVSVPHGSALEGQQGALDCLELELRTVEKGLGVQPRSSRRRRSYCPGHLPALSLFFIPFKVGWGLTATAPVWHLQRLEDNLWESVFKCSET